jgi:hypothetical protein
MKSYSLSNIVSLLVFGAGLLAMNILPINVYAAKTCHPPVPADGLCYMSHCDGDCACVTIQVPC